ncbi:MAG: site-specific DNA-methyltransferase [Bacteroidaceae bacterium]|nr:site-specific DNA-methyltransferase [Bacteroidaceae bacterium]
MPQAYFETSDFILYQGDSLSLITTLEDSSIDVVFADPPYFLSSGRKMDIAGRKVNFEKGAWDRCRTTEDVDSFNETWINAIAPKMKEDATIWVSGTFHNIFSVERILVKHRFKIINIISWQKSNPHDIVDGQHLTFSTEFLVWARKSYHGQHFYNHELMVAQNGGKPLTDVWKLPTPSAWERKHGKHPTQKPLRLLYRIILASTREGETILDPFAGSCTTGIAANLLGRKFIGIDQSQEFFDYGIRRKHEIEDASKAEWMLKKMSENPEEVMVMVNHARPDLYKRMIETGICYLRAGDSKGSLLVTPGFERLNYVLLHTNGENAQLFKLKTRGHFQIWTRETLQQYGFEPRSAAYYVVLHFEPSKPIPLKHHPKLKVDKYTFNAKIRPLSDFIGIK